MKRCVDCQADIAGTWSHCPLCATPTTGQPSPSGFPDVPLSFSRRRIFKILFLSSIVVILGSFAAQLVFDANEADIGILRSLWLGITAMWLVVLLAVRKRRNVAKNIVYLNLAVGLICVYWDYLTDWHGWSLDYAVPIVLAASIVALVITVRVMRMEVGEYIVYSGLTVLLGLTPIVFLVFGWVSQPLPSAICAAISIIALVTMQVYRGAEVRHELAKRLHL